MLKSLCGLLLCLLATGAAAQTFREEWRPYDAYEAPEPVLRVDSSLFYRAQFAADDLYGACTAFSLPPVALCRRGRSWRSETASLDGVEVSYRSFRALRLLGADERSRPGAGFSSGGAGIVGVAGGVGGLREFSFADALPLRPRRASVHFSGRNYLVGARFAASDEWRGGWSCAAAADLRTGRDLYVGGVFTDAATAAFRLSRRWGGSQRLSLVTILPLSVRGMRLAATEEAFCLTGDRLYNPAWGYQDGKVRNARVRREWLPQTVVGWRGAVSPASSLFATLGVEAGLRRYSALGWYDARTPLPDHYRYMPSFAGDRETGEAWRTNDARYTQIDWDYLIAMNRSAGGRAVYALEDRAERLCDLRLAAGGETHLGERTTVGCALSWSRRVVRSFKRMRDLLGASWLDDIDQWLVDDDTFGNLLQNDLRRPGRRIAEGDRFGYDYSMIEHEARISLRADFRCDRFQLSVAAEAGDVRLFRRGHMEKELFAGDRSFGRSRTLRFPVGAAKLSMGWAFSARSHLHLEAAAGAGAPDAEALFVQPLYNNRTIDDPHAVRFFGAELGWRFATPVVEFQAAGFLTAQYDGVQSLRCFDDLSGLYCDAAVTRIADRMLGAEAAVSVRLSPRWRLSAAASAGRYRYIRNPEVTLLSDADNTAVDTRAESFVGGCMTGGAPQLTATAGLSYFGPKGWGVRLSAGYAGLRWVEPSLVRRTGRILRQAGTTAEAFADFMTQQRLPDAFTGDAALFKSFDLGRARLAATLAVHNLTGARRMAVDGYESSRVRRVTAGDGLYFRPHDTRYTYAWPRTFSLTLSCRF